MDIQNKDKIKIGIVILNWNNYSDTKETIKTIEKQSFNNIEMVIVDGFSSDDSTKRIQAEFPKYHYIYLKEDNGYTGGNNAGIKYLLNRKVDYIVSMNNDALLRKNCLRDLVNYAEENNLGIVGPRMYSYYEKDLFERSGGYVSIFKSKSMPKWIKESDAPAELSKPYSVKKLPGAMIMLSKEVVKKVGLMDEQFFLYYGDTDWQKRISDAGYDQIVIPKAKAYHKVSATTGRGSVKVLYYDTRDFLNYVKKHHSLFALTYSFFKSYFQRSINVVRSDTKNKFKQLRYLNLSYYHFLLGKKGKGI